MARLPIICLLLIACSCRQKTSQPMEEMTDESTPPLSQTDTPGALERSMINGGLVNIKDAVPGVFVDLRYTTTNNFLQTDLYGDLNNAYLQPDVAEKLKIALELLKKKESSLSFLVFDATRPLSVQKKMWELVDVPLSERSKYVSNPANGSIHNYGAAIDITLCTTAGVELDMGTDYDYFGELAQPLLEHRFLQSGELTQQQVANRRLLRTVMQQAGFRQLPTEWWHYNSCSREVAQTKYRIIE